jgi:hypothetical protein
MNSSCTLWVSHGQQRSSLSSLVLRRLLNTIEEQWGVTRDGSPRLGQPSMALNRELLSLARKKSRWAGDLSDKRNVTPSRFAIQHLSVHRSSGYFTSLQCPFEWHLYMREIGDRVSGSSGSEETHQLNQYAVNTKASRVRASVLSHVLVIPIDMSASTYRFIPPAIKSESQLVMTGQTAFPMFLVGL